MAELRMFTVHVSYKADVMLKVDESGEPFFNSMLDTLSSFGARDTHLDFKPYTGAGQHEFVGSSDPGLSHLQICVKCAKRKDVAGDTCAGVGK